MNKELAEIKSFLDEAYLKYNNKQFIEHDPICIPHRFSKKEDIEIAGFFAATIAWGNRKSIITNAQKLMQLMDDSPFSFVTGSSVKELDRLDRFVHRTFNGRDCIFFVHALRNIYKHHGGLENVFAIGKKQNAGDAIVKFREVFLETKHLSRSEKHISNPANGSSAKRLCMYLRWMVRKDKMGVDFGIWNKIDPSQLCLPLDIHTGNIARSLGLLGRTQNDWKSVMELTDVLKVFDASDPVKYDFSLFGIGVNNDLEF